MTSCCQHASNHAAQNDQREEHTTQSANCFKAAVLDTRDECQHAMEHQEFSKLQAQDAQRLSREREKVREEESDMPNAK